ncbi:helix-turn-helix domain-containing protein [Nocardia terpenica]|uniref:helix-turn-helix domain-containing protein n=1 Tax=Nocardia terpenica TaxID=455432 RepID=UPI0039E167D0
MVAVARRLFATEGYESTTMATIAKAAGITGNTAYWYFQDKDELLVAVLETAVAETIGRPPPLGGRRPPTGAPTDYHRACTDLPVPGH